jgi:hypothetical protein
MALRLLTTSVVLFTVLHYDHDAWQVDLDLYTSWLTPLRCATTLAALTIQVVTGTYVE